MLTILHCSECNKETSLPFKLVLIRYIIKLSKQQNKDFFSIGQEVNDKLNELIEKYEEVG